MGTLGATMSAPRKTPARPPRTRLNVSLTPESRAALERFSEATGIASSQLIRSVMHDAIPVIEAMTEAMAIAKTAPQQAADLMTHQLLTASARAAQLNIELQDTVKQKRLRKRPR